MPNRGYTSFGHVRKETSEVLSEADADGNLLRPIGMVDLYLRTPEWMQFNDIDTADGFPAGTSSIVAGPPRAF